MNYWDILEIKRTSDKKQVKRAYAKLLKYHKPEHDPDGYQRLRDAFDQAIQYCKQNSDGSGGARSSVPLNSDSYQNLGDDELGLAHTSNQASIDIEQINCDQELYKYRGKIDEESRGDWIAANNINNNEQLKKDELDRKRQHEAQEILRIQQDAELNAKQQRIKEQQEHLIADELNSILLNILSLNDVSDAISAFQNAMNTDVLLNLKNRKMFEQVCFRCALEWDNSIQFPSELFMQIADEFDWYGKNPTDHYFLENIDTLRARISAGVEYQALVKHAKKSDFSRATADDVSQNDAAQIILGAYRPILFNIKLFIHSDIPDGIKKILYTFTEKYPLESCPEIDNESFRWWLQRQSKYNFTIAHVFMGAAFATLVVSWAMRNNSDPISGMALVLVYAVSMAAGSVASWWVLRFLSHWWRKVAPTIRGVFEEIEHNPYIYYGVTVLYVLLFLSSSYTDDQNYTVLWFSIAGVLVILLLRSAILFVCINAIVFFCVGAYLEVIISHQAFKYLFIYIGIASYYVWLGIMRKLPSRISGIFSERLFGALISLILISGSLSYLSLVTLNAIYQ